MEHTLVQNILITVAAMTITVVIMIGTFGAIWGGTLATLRNENRAFYSSAMGANFFLLGATYTSMV